MKVMTFNFSILFHYELLYLPLDMYMKGQRHLGGEFKTKSAQSAMLAHSAKQNNQSVKVAAVSQQPQFASQLCWICNALLHNTRLMDSKAMSGLLFGNDKKYSKHTSSDDFFANTEGLQPEERILNGPAVSRNVPIK